MIPKVVDTLMQMGMNRTIATMSIQTMWLTPSIADRYNAGTLAVVKALQSHLGLPQTGQIDPKLASILARYCGSTWRMQTWLAIYQKVIAVAGRPQWKVIAVAGRPQWEEKTMSYSSGMGDMFEYAAEMMAEGVAAGLSTVKSKYCSPFNPQGNCKPVAGLCKPMTWAALAEFKRLQGGLNRLAYGMRFPMIAIDGRIGPGTVSLANKTIGWKSGSCDDLALRADTVGDSVHALADSRGYPKTPPKQPPKPRQPPSVPAPGGSVMNPTSGLSLVNRATQFAMSPMGLFFIAGLAAWKFGLLDAVLGPDKPPPKKKVKRKKPAIRRRRPRRRVTQTWF